MIMRLRSWVVGYSQSAIVPLVLILLAAFCLRFYLAPGVSTNAGLLQVEDAWRLAQRVEQGITDPDGSLDLSALPGLAAELRAEEGIYRLAHLTPLALSLGLAGPSEASAHFLPLLSTIVTVYLVYALGRILGGQVTGLMAALLWAVMPVAIAYENVELFTSFYFTASLATITAWLWAIGHRRWLGYGVSLLAWLVVAAAIPWLGLALLIFMLAALLLARLPEIESRQVWEARALIVLGLLILVLQLVVSPIADPSWTFFGELLSRRESILFLPLLIFAMAWSARAAWPGVKRLYLTFGLSYVTWVGFQWPVEGREFLFENILGLDLLLPYLPMVLLGALYLAHWLRPQRVASVSALTAGLLIVLSLANNWFSYDSAPSQALFSILEILAGLALFAWLLSPALDRLEHNNLRLGLSTLVFVSLAFGFSHYAAQAGLQQGDLNRASLKAAERTSIFLPIRDIYVCPDELGTRLWFLQDFESLPSSPAEEGENPYRSFPRSVERRNEGILIVSQGCTSEVSSLFDTHLPVILGNYPESRIRIYNVRGNPAD